jgi:hypothetical protein
MGAREETSRRAAQATGSGCYLLVALTLAGWWSPGPGVDTVRPAAPRGLALADRRAGGNTPGQDTTQAVLIVIVKTGTGTLTYLVSKVYIVPKTDVGRTDEYRLGRDHQAKFNTCGIDLLHQVDTDYAVIINADLTAAVPL